MIPSFKQAWIKIALFVLGFLLLIALGLLFLHSCLGKSNIPSTSIEPMKDPEPNLPDPFRLEGIPKTPRSEKGLTEI